MNVEALQRLIHILENVEKQGLPFNINSWWDIHPSGFSIGQDLEKPCGTAACAIGWAACDPWFKEQGLSIRAEALSKSGNPKWLVPHFQGARGFEAAAKLFGIEVYVAQVLFDPHEYFPDEDVGTTPRDVIDRINHLIRTGSVHE